MLLAFASFVRLFEGLLSGGYEDANASHNHRPDDAERADR